MADPDMALGVDGHAVRMPLARPEPDEELALARDVPSGPSACR